MSNLNPLRYCFYGKHAKPRATFRMLPGAANARAVCAECYEKLKAGKPNKKK